MDVSVAVWIGFYVILACLLYLDLVVLNRRAHVVSMREAAILSVFWTLVAVAMGIFILIAYGVDAAVLYATAEVTERALSIDNLFVFLVIISYFRVPPEYQSRALIWGIIGVLITRAIFIGAGVAIINTFSWTLFILGGVLIITAYKMAFRGEKEMAPNRNVAMRVASKFIRVSENFEGTNFFTRNAGYLTATPMFMVVLVLVTTDVMFAIDSIPAVFGITQEPFLIWTSNAMAVLGMRPMYFLLAGFIRLFRFLEYGLAGILAFVGIKIIAEHAFSEFHVISERSDVYLALLIIVMILTFSVIASVIFPKRNPDHVGLKN